MKDKYSNLVKEFETTQNYLSDICENAIREGQYFNLFIKYKLEETFKKYSFPFCATIIIQNDTQYQEKEKLMEFLNSNSNEIALSNVSNKLSEMPDKEITVHHQFVLMCDCEDTQPKNTLNDWPISFWMGDINNLHIDEEKGFKNDIYKEKANITIEKLFRKEEIFINDLFKDLISLPNGEIFRYVFK